MTDVSRRNGRKWVRRTRIRCGVSEGGERKDEDGGFGKHDERVGFCENNEGGWS